MFFWKRSAFSKIEIWKWKNFQTNIGIPIFDGKKSQFSVIFNVEDFFPNNGQITLLREKCSIELLWILFMEKGFFS